MVNYDQIQSEQPIFHQKWWLDAVTDNDEWGESCVVVDNNVLAKMPWVLKKKYGFKILSQPPFTQYLGPFFTSKFYNSNYSKILSKEKDYTQKIINQLPKHDYFLQNFSPFISNHLPWHWNNYQETTKYTYQIDLSQGIDKIYNNLQTKIRGDINKALKKGVLIKKSNSIDELIEISKKTFLRQNVRYPYNIKILERLHSACTQRNASKVFLAIDKKKQIHAGLYLVYSNNISHMLILGSDPVLRNSGSNSLLVWECIKYAAKVSNSFDFEGSMIKPVESFFRGFGAIQKPYFSIWKFENRLYKALFQIKKTFQK